MSSKASSTVRTETVDYRGYELRVIEWLGTWQVSISPLRETLPFLSLTEELPSAPTSEEAFAKARWRVDRLLEEPDEPADQLRRQALAGDRRTDDVVGHPDGLAHRTLVQLDMTGELLALFGAELISRRSLRQELRR